MSKKDKDYIIKEDGTIVRGPKLKELKKKLTSKKTDKKDDSNKKTNNGNNGCIDKLIAFIVVVSITTILGGVVGFFVDEPDSFEFGILIGGTFGILSCIGEIFFPDK